MLTLKEIQKVNDLTKELQRLETGSGVIGTNSTLYATMLGLADRDGKTKEPHINANKYLRDYLPEITQYLEGRLDEAVKDRIDEIKLELTHYIKPESEVGG